MSGYPRYVKILSLLAAGLFSLFILGAIAVGGAFLYFNPKLPQPGAIGEVNFSEPLRIYTADGRLIAQYGLKRRVPVTFDEIPPLLIHAFVAAEDDRFFQHHGVDIQGILRAAWNLVLTGNKSQGGSTITMQLARNLYLSPKRTYVRKIKEIILALRLESKLTKDQILELYLNMIYLGNGAYGVGAAAQIYYDKSLAELTVAQAATIAGLPKAPSHYNPAEYPQRAQVRRDYVLRRMREENYISQAQYQAALAEPVTTATAVADDRFEADYLAEMARQVAVEKFGEKAAYTTGYEVVLTVNSQRQRAANRALRRALLAYDQRHAWRGPEAAVAAQILGDDKAMDDALAARPEAGGLVPALVLSAANDKAQ
ncbi:MAG: transglycosylase domain-containing protein, partial [Salinisphaera sp.]|nr:transglycosylase domain-containing protein [Salinisphaera sp.]